MSVMTKLATTTLAARFWMWLDRNTGGDETCDLPLFEGSQYECMRRHLHFGPHVVMKQEPGEQFYLVWST